MPHHARPVALLLACLLFACDDGPASPSPDAARGDARPADAAALDAMSPDAELDGAAPDATPDAAVDTDPDGGVDQGVEPAFVPCPVRPQIRPDGALRVTGCRMVRDGEAAALPRVVVVSGDSLVRAAATPFHEAPMYADLARAGVDVVWLLAQWNGIEPMRGTYNGAYLARMCQQARWASDAGLDVVLSMHQQRFGPGLGGHGMPPWATPAGLAMVPEDAGPDHPSLAAAWAAFWADPGLRADYIAAWGRLIATCAQDEGHGIDGIHAISDPMLGAIGDTIDGISMTHDAIIDAVHGVAEAELGPQLRFVSPIWRADGLVWPAVGAPETVRVLPGWGPARWPGAADPPAEWRREAGDAAWLAGEPLWLVGVGGLDAAAADAAVDTVEAAGLVGAIWQDGFASPYGLRDEDGRPVDAWRATLDRPRPARLAGRPLAWGEAPDGVITLRWVADGTEQGLSRFAMAGRPAGRTALNPDDGDWFTDYDPVTDLLAIFVDGPPRIVELTIEPVEDAP